MRTFDRTLPLLRSNLTLFGRDPGPLVARIVQPILLVLLLRPLYVAAWGDKHGTVQVVAGYLVMFSLLGMSIVGTSILTERRWSTFDRLRASPARVAELFAGKAIPILVFLLLQQAVILALGVLVFDLPVASYPLLLATCATWSVTVLCLGTAIAMLVHSYAQLSAIIDIGATIAAALGGGLVPLTSLPAWARALAPGWPSYWAMKGLRAALRGDPHTTLICCGVLLFVATLAATLAGRRLSHGWGRSVIDLIDPTTIPPTASPHDSCAKRVEDSPNETYRYRLRSPA